MKAPNPARWDAKAEHDIGVFIGRYVRENPPPPGMLFADDFKRWGEKLVRHGEARLRAAGARRLGSVV